VSNPTGLTHGAGWARLTALLVDELPSFMVPDPKAGHLHHRDRFEVARRWNGTAAHPLRDRKGVWSCSGLDGAPEELFEEYRMQTDPSGRHS